MDFVVSCADANNISNKDFYSRNCFNCDDILICVIRLVIFSILKPILCLVLHPRNIYCITDIQNEEVWYFRIRCLIKYFIPTFQIHLHLFPSLSVLNQIFRFTILRLKALSFSSSNLQPQKITLSFADDDSHVWWT